MIVHEIAAISAASCWAFASLFATSPSRQLGAIAFNQIRMALVFVMLMVVVIITGGWITIQHNHIWPIVMSGFIGIFLGDTALFLTMNRLGPRRTSILFALNAPIATLLAWLTLDESMPLQSLLGILMVIGGVILAIASGRGTAGQRTNQNHHWEQISGSVWAGVGLGLIAATAQATGALIMRPIMLDGVDPVASSAIRVGVSTLCLTLLMQLPVQGFQQKKALNRRIFSGIAISGFLGMALGMTLFIFALTGGKVGIVTSLSATAPILLLPIIWIRTGQKPSSGAWLGALLVVVGAAFIFLN